MSLSSFDTPLAAVAAHRSSHQKLLGKLPGPLRSSWRGSRSEPVPALDAVVVTTCRGADSARSGLATATAIALDRGCPVLVLVAGRATTPEVVADVRAQGGPVTVVDVDAATHRLPRFGVDRLVGELAGPDARSGTWASGGLPLRTIGETRNLALVIAHAAGWSRILFLDDDVREWPTRTQATLNQAGLTAALRATADGRPTRAVGWTLRDFDDNSVVCRARSKLGLRQEQFIGGGALLVRCTSTPAFFPSIYNEDWLFLLGLLRPEHGPDAPQSDGPQSDGPQSDVVLIGGSVKQDGYHPFAPGRAAREEMGDVLAEGLYGLLHPDTQEYFGKAAGKAGRDPFTVGAGSTDYWQAVIRHRRQMIEELVETADPMAPSADAELHRALVEALEAHRGLFWTGTRGGRTIIDHRSVDTLQQYVRTLRRDQRKWASFLDQDHADWLVDDLRVPLQLLAAGVAKTASTRAGSGQDAELHGDGDGKRPVVHSELAEHS